MHDQSPNPFSPPTSKVVVADRPQPRPIKAVIVGALIDIGGTLVVGTAVGVAFTVVLASRGLSVEQIEQELTNVDPGSAIGLLSSLLGALISLGAGYVCARIAGAREYLAGAILATLSLAFGLALGGAYYSAAEHLILGSLTVAAVMLGVYIGARRNRGGFSSSQA